MNSKEEVVRLLWTLAGAVVGVAVGFGLMTYLLPMMKLPPLGTAIAVLAFCGGGLIGGGFVTLTVLNKRQKVARKKYFDEKKKKKKRK
ncbi:MAG: hypothetical protein ABFE07_07365 [Armatimonadia bacterium]